MQLIIKILWFSVRNARSSIKLFFFKILSGSFFRSIGSGTKIFGRIRFGTVENNIEVGKNCMLGHEIFFSATKGAFINIGDNCSINTGCHLVAIDRIIIKTGTRIGEYCTIRDQNHSFDDLTIPIYKQGFLGAPVFIGEDCWIGRGVIITSGVTLGNGCVVGANSVVTKSFDANSVIAGVPAKLMRKRGAVNQ